MKVDHESDLDFTDEEQAAMDRALGATADYMVWLRSQQGDGRKTVKASPCGAGAPGDPGFQHGNTCASGGAGASADARSQTVDRMAELRFRNRLGQLTHEEVREFAGLIRENEQDLFEEAFDRADEKFASWVKSEHAAHLADASSKKSKFAQRMLNERLAKFIDSSGLDDSTKAVYREMMESASSSLNHKKAQMVQKAIKDAEFYPTTAELKQDLNHELDLRLGPDVEMAGAFASNDSHTFGKLFLDGQSPHTAQLPSSIAAHELGHALDRGAVYRGRFTASPEWQEAYTREILWPPNDPPLSDYATVDEEEGFAEYTRLVHDDPEKAIREFPRTWQLWRDL